MELSYRFTRELKVVALRRLREQKLAREARRKGGSCWLHTAPSVAAARTRFLAGQRLLARRHAPSPRIQVPAMADRTSALSADLYEFTMAAAYSQQAQARGGAEPVATFELFVRKLPPGWAFLIACGLEQALAFMRGLEVTAEEIEYLRSLPVMRHVEAPFWERLSTLRFTGEVWAMPEGTRFYANQPLLRVTAPVIEAQLVETTLLSILGFQTAVATKAARVVQAAAGRRVLEMGARHAHGPQAALYASRAAHQGGCYATANTEAGMRFGIPVSGTMAHSFVMAQGGGEDDEGAAFAAFCALFPDHATLLLDTYDTLRGLDRMLARGLRPRAVRLDSGDLLALSRGVRARLDAAGMREVEIVATGDLDEDLIAALVAADAPINVYGVGTAITVVKDHPYLSAVYKLVHIEGPGVAPGTEGRAKRSTDKATTPGKKQVWRVGDPAGGAPQDTVALADTHPPPAGRPLLARVLP